MTTVVSRIFTNGNSQAVRIPHALRLNARRVEITRTEQGDLIIHPIDESKGHALLAALEGFDDDFIAHLEDNRAEAPGMQDREPL